MKSPSLPVAVLLLSFMATATTAFLVLEFGKKCPKPFIERDFNATRYMGKWWEYQRFPAPFEFASTCGFANYTLLSRDSIKVYNYGLQKIKLFQWAMSRKPILAEGEAVVVDPSKPRELKVEFPNSVGGMGTQEGPNYFVVYTDYENVSVVFSCTDFLIGNFQFAWILTRGQGSKPANLDDIHKNLADSGINIRNFITVDQTDCHSDL